MLAYQGLLSDRRVFVVSTETGAELRRFDWRDREGGVILPVFSHDGKTLILGDAEPQEEDRGTFVAYDVATGAERWRFKAVGDYFEEFFLSPDGRVLAAKWVRNLVLYETPGGRVRHRLELVNDNEENITFVAFAPDSASLVTGHQNGTIRFWDVATGRTPRHFTGQEYDAEWMAFAPDGKVMAVIGLGRPSIRLLDVATGRELARLEGHRGYVPALAFSSDGSLLATGGSDTTVVVWDLSPYRAGGE
jgi:WD40 repeat protein